MQKHIRDLAEGLTVNGKPANVALDLRVQPSGAKAAQQLIKYGKERGIAVTVKEFK